MDPVTSAFVIAVIEIAFKYGVPAAIEVIQSLSKENVTLADIEALKTRVPHPDEYIPPQEG